jgi:hypothetical protein
MIRAFTLLQLLLLLSWQLLAQMPTWKPPKGKFLTDSVKIGLPVKYAISYRHKASVDVFFPDSTFNYAPFELLNREYYPTVTDANGSVDSVVYTLTTFEVNRVQKLSLPVFVRSKQDCTRVFSPMDSVYLNPILKGKIDRTLALKEDTQTIRLSQQANYPLIFLIFLGLSVLAGIIFWLFGKPIRRQIKLFQFRRRYEEYHRLFQRLSKASEDRKRRVNNVEKAVVLWKIYIERLEEKPFTTFTTKEILDNLKDDRLSDALREIDGTIYGGNFSKKTVASLAILDELAQGLYREHRQNLIDSAV